MKNMQERNETGHKAPLFHGFLAYPVSGDYAERRHAGAAFSGVGLSRKPYIVPIPGTTKKERLVENAGAAEVSLSESEMAEIERILKDIPSK